MATASPPSVPSAMTLAEFHALRASRPCSTSKLTVGEAVQEVFRAWALYGAIGGDKDDTTNCYYLSTNVMDLLGGFISVHSDRVRLDPAEYSGPHYLIQPDVYGYLESYCAEAGFIMHVDRKGAVEIRLPPPTDTN